MTNVFDTDIQPVSAPAILIKQRQTDVRKQTDKSSVAGVFDGDNMQSSAPAVQEIH